MGHNLFVRCRRSVERIPATTVFHKMLTFTERTMRQEKGEVMNFDQVCNPNRSGDIPAQSHVRLGVFFPKIPEAKV